MKHIYKCPPMGWNSWYCFSVGVTEQRIRNTAEAMVKRGLASHGWSYINIDDCWQGERGGKYGAVQGNERFPDMQGLGKYIHSCGLKFGLYSTPWICSYAGFTGGSSDHGREKELYIPMAERSQPTQFFGGWPNGNKLGLYRTGEEWLLEKDFRQWNEWEADFVKMDWYPNDIPTTRRIAEGLAALDRDILLSLSNNTPIENIGELSKLAQMWRISGDIRDAWQSIDHIGFEIAPKWLPYASQGHWNDLDMLQIGSIGTANAMNPSYRPSKLTFEEQKTQFVLWSMYSAPLLLSCDIAGMDDQTFGLLTNDRVIAIDQDELCARPVITRMSEGVLRYDKELTSGKAVAFFNRNDSESSIALAKELEGSDAFTGKMGCFAKIELPVHGCKVFLQQA